jgi:hypothetical protein
MSLADVEARADIGKDLLFLLTVFLCELNSNKEHEEGIISGGVEGETKTSQTVRSNMAFGNICFSLFYVYSLTYYLGGTRVRGET